MAVYTAIMKTGSKLYGRISRLRPGFLRRNVILQACQRRPVRADNSETFRAHPLMPERTIRIPEEERGRRQRCNRVAVERQL